MTRLSDLYACAWCLPNGPTFLDFGDNTLGLSIRHHSAQHEFQTAVGWIMNGTGKDQNPEVYPVFLDDLLTRYALIIRTLPDNEWKQLRSVAIQGCLEVMRDSQDSKLRAEAWEVLVTLGVAE